MAFTAAHVKNLREMTGVGMMDCKKALTASDGDFDKAVEFLREKGLAASQKKAGRIAAEGMAYAASIDGVGVVVEVNAETDFVAKNDKFVEFVKGVAATVAACKPADLDALMECKYNGTELTVGMIGEAVFCGGSEVSRQNIVFNPNIPTEECFISPKKGEAEGIVYSSLPLSYGGQLIENFYMRFKDGKVIESGAEKNADLLAEMLATDEGASYLGECALVPYSSPIRKSGVLFYSTLYDENAACHFAIGRGFSNVLRDFEKYSEEEAHNLGINDSVTHVDFMIGTSDLSITGIDKNGNEVKIFENGEWAF